MSLLAPLLNGTWSDAEAALLWGTRRPFPRHMFPDVDYGGFQNRMETSLQLLIERGGFSPSTSMKILVDGRAKTKERAAAWLRKELERLQNSERVLGSAPVLTGSAMSRLTISDLAISMLQILNEAPGTNLICLLQGLLNVDRHRFQLAKDPDPSQDSAAMHDARSKLTGKTLTVRRLAEIADADPSSISRWRRTTAYKQEVEALVESYQERLRFLIQEGRAHGLSLENAVERALELDDARSVYKKYRAELSEKLNTAKNITEVRRIWRQHVEHAIAWGTFFPTTADRVTDLFEARINELESTDHSR
jgi:hypothetical protein